MDFKSQFDGAGLEKRPRYSVDDALKALPINTQELVPVQIIFGFSDLDPADTGRVREAWMKLLEDQRIIIMERLAEGSEVDYLLDYAVFARIGFDDPSAAVRQAAIRAGWSDESPQALERIMRLVEEDSSTDVRAAAIAQVGQFIYLAEMEEFDDEDAEPARQLALDILHDPGESLEVQRRALESVAHCSRDEVTRLIEVAYHHDDLMMRVSAVCAMGNSSDERWHDIIMDEISSNSPEIAYEAIRSAGAIGLVDSVHRISKFGYSSDPQLQEVAVWALGEIGGDEAVDALYAIQDYGEEQGNDELIEAAEDALAMANMMSDLAGGLDTFGFDPDEYDGDEDYDDEDFDDGDYNEDYDDMDEES
ncbi:MAG TPA: hypothetical protein VJZ27_08850 [Aggregatilineales bacterium]|nr:hypothetical protein [Aggregatilineales bacterium]